jgi:hypothetical protein
MPDFGKEDGTAQPTTSQQQEPTPTMGGFVMPDFNE